MMTELKPLFTNARDSGSPLDVVPVAGRIGAEIRNIAVSGDLDAATVTAIRAALMRHKVIFFRDQHSLDDAGQEAFASLLGMPAAHPTVPEVQGSKYLMDLESKAGEAVSSWHTDLTFMHAPSEAAILRALVVPEAGGDTLWANTATAYEGLPEAVKSMVNNLSAVHTNVFDYAATFQSSGAGSGGGNFANYASTQFETEHPLVHVHPETGERCLLVGHFIKKIVGLSSEESAAVMRMLQDHITKPENTVRWRWRVGDIAIWDNRATQHRAIADFGMQPRHMRRVALSGVVPVGIDGRASRAIKPVPQLAA